MSKARAIVLLACILAGAPLAACQTASQAASTTAAAQSEMWRCPNGEEIATAYQDDGGVVLRARGYTYRLPGVIAADGNRYSDGQVEFWSKGDEALLTGVPGGDVYDCALH